MIVFEKNKKALIIGLGLILISFGLVFFINYLNSNIDTKSSVGKSYLKNYKVNEIVPIIVDESDMAKKYLAEYIDYVLKDREKAYSMLDEEYKKNRYPNIDKFNDYLEQIIDINFVQAMVKKYSLVNKGEYTRYDIIDNDGNTFIIKEYSIMNYTVMFDNYSV